MLSPDDAAALANEWRPRFADESNFEDSWSRYFKMNGTLSVDTLHSWLARDLARDAAQHAGHAPELGRDVFGRQLAVVHAEQQVCPLCRGHFEGTYLDHTIEAHKVRPVADKTINNLPLRAVRNEAKARYLEACAAAGYVDDERVTGAGRCAR